jgi:hypothetical protein
MQLALQTILELGTLLIHVISTSSWHNGISHFGITAAERTYGGYGKTPYFCIP